MLFQISRWLHKYVGLFLIVFCVWESVSGILLNHPGITRSVSLPRWMIPPQYRVVDWNRSALRSVVFLPQRTDTTFAWGWEGVWRSTDGGETFDAFNAGLPTDPYMRRVNSFWFDEDKRYLLAGMNAGLYIRGVNEGRWHHLPLGTYLEPVERILHTRDRLVVFTSSNAYCSDPQKRSIGFTQMPFDREDPDPSVSLVRLFFALHGGHAWGLPGRILFDLFGLLIIFMSVSAFYVWYWPWRGRRSGTASPLSAVKRIWFGLFQRYHLKLGIWVALPFLVIGGTGLFMRPPTIALLFGNAIPAACYPGFRYANPWHELIQNACYDSLNDRILVEADGFWSGPADFSAPFTKAEFDAPVFAMGTTVLECDGSGEWLVGSFGGLFRYNPETDSSFDVLRGEPMESFSVTRPADFMVTGVLRNARWRAVCHGTSVGTPLPERCRAKRPLHHAPGNCREPADFPVERHVRTSQRTHLQRPDWPPLHPASRCGCVSLLPDYAHGCLRLAGETA